MNILSRYRGPDQTLFYTVIGSSQYGVVMMNSCSMAEVEIELKRVIDYWGGEMKKSPVDVSTLNTVYTFDVLWRGWEMDNIGYIAQDEDGNKYPVLTSHGSKYIADKSELLDKISEYADAMNQTNKALKMLEGGVGNDNTILL